MLRNTFLAVFAVLALGAVAQAAITAGAEGDGKISLKYDASNGNITLQPDGAPGGIGLFQVLSAGNIFTGSASAALPPGGLGLDVKAAGEIAWAALPTAAVNAPFNIGNIATTGLTQAFLLTDLTFNVSGGLGTENAVGDLVCIGCGGGQPLVPDIATVAVGEYESAAVITRLLQASNGPNTWSALTPTAGTPALAATLTPQGEFSWNPAGSRRGPKGNGIAYSWTATATNPAGADTGVAITLSLIPEPATVSLLGLAIVSFVGLFRRR